MGTVDGRCGQSRTEARDLAQPHPETRHRPADIRGASAFQVAGPLIALPPPLSPAPAWIAFPTFDSDDLFQPCMKRFGGAQRRFALLCDRRPHAHNQGYTVYVLFSACSRATLWVCVLVDGHEIT